MKQITQLLKLEKSARMFLVAIALCLSFGATAQCTSNYSYVVDPSNNGDVTFTNLSSGTGLHYQWNMGNGTVFPNIYTPGTYNFASSGTYAVCLLVYDSIGVTAFGGIISSCYDSICMPITVINSLATCNAYFYATPDSMGTIYITNFSAGTITNYFWDFGDGTSSTLANPSTHIYPAPGYYTICLTTTNPSTMCNSTYCDTILVPVPPSCGSSFTYVADSIVPNGFSFTGSSTGTGDTYYWDFGDGTNSTLQNPNHVYPSAPATWYNVCLTVTSSTDSTCNSTSCQMLYASGVCNASFFAADSAGIVHFYNASTGTGLTCSWTFGDGNVGTSTGDITHVYASPGSYVVCLTITNFAGTCTATYCDSILVGTGSSGACLGVVDPTYTYSESSGTVNFTNTVSGSGPVYNWDFGDGSNSSTVGSTSHTYSANGVYLVCLTVYETGSGTDSCQYCDYVYVNGIVTGCTAAMTVVQDSTNLYNYFVYYAASTPSGSPTYFWDFGDGTSSTLPYPSHTYATTTPVVLCLTVTDGLICSTTVCDSITPGMAMSSTWTLNVMNPMGVEEIPNISSLENYPNPFGESTTIKYSIAKDATVSILITDLLGNIVAELENGKRNAGEYAVTWNPENVAGGMYLLQLKADNEISTKKLLLNK